jgi:hypothetical protein
MPRSRSRAAKGAKPRACFPPWASCLLVCFRSYADPRRGRKLPAAAAAAAAAAAPLAVKPVVRPNAACVSAPLSRADNHSHAPFSLIPIARRAAEDSGSDGEYYVGPRTAKKVCVCCRSTGRSVRPLP